MKEDVDHEMAARQGEQFLEDLNDLMEGLPILVIMSVFAWVVAAVTERTGLPTKQVLDDFGMMVRKAKAEQETNFAEFEDYRTSEAVN